MRAAICGAAALLLALLGLLGASPARMLGERNLVDVVGEMADYASASASLSAFNQQMPPGFRQFLPLPFTPPDDIHPDSRSRLPLLAPVALRLAARKHGLEQRVIDVIRNHAPTTGLSDKDASLIEFGLELFDRHYVTAATYARTEKIFGEGDLVSLVAVMGQHAGEEVMLAAFDQQLPEGQTPLCCASH